jgi:hypothetical protein
MRKITVTASTVALLCLSLTSGASVAATKYVSWLGTWHLNKTETHYPPGVMVTDNDLVVSVDDGNTLKYVETVVNAGKTDVQNFEGTYDGTPSDLGNGQTMFFKRVSANSSYAERHNKDGFVLEKTTFVISHHGKKLVCHVWAEQPGGKPIKFDEIFDKGA